MLQILQQLDNTPNAPYFPQAISAKVKKILNDLEMPFREDHLGIYVHYRHGNPLRKVIIDTHLDHPAFVTDKNSQIKAIGTICSSEEELNDLQSCLPYPVDIYDKSGLYIGESQIITLKLQSGNLYAELDGTIPLSPNLQIIPRLQTKFSDVDLQMRSADNLSVTACVLELINWLKQEQPPADLTIVFSKLEEVRQASSTLTLIKPNKHITIDAETIIIVLEAGLVENNAFTLSLTGTTQNYQNGPIIRIGDNQLPFVTPATPNLAESILISATKNVSGSFQHGASVSNANTTPYFLFGNSPHVAGITVPCRYKHNFSTDGFTCEVVRLKDLQAATGALQELVLQSNHPISVHRDALLTGEEIAPAHNQIIKEKKKIWANTARLLEPRIIQGYLVPETLNDLRRIALGNVSRKIISSFES